MLKFKKIELLTKTSRNITCCADMRKIFFFRGGEGGLVVC